LSPAFAAADTAAGADFVPSTSASSSIPFPTGGNHQRHPVPTLEGSVASGAGTSVAVGVAVTPASQTAARPLHVAPVAGRRSSLPSPGLAGSGKGGVAVLHSPSRSPAGRAAHGGSSGISRIAACDAGEVPSVPIYGTAAAASAGPGLGMGAGPGLVGMGAGSGAALRARGASTQATASPRAASTSLTAAAAGVSDVGGSLRNRGPLSVPLSRGGVGGARAAGGRGDRGGKAAAAVGAVAGSRSPAPAGRRSLPATAASAPAPAAAPTVAPAVSGGRRGLRGHSLGPAPGPPPQPQRSPPPPSLALAAASSAPASSASSSPADALVSSRSPRGGAAWPAHHSPRGGALLLMAPLVAVQAASPAVSSSATGAPTQPHAGPLLIVAGRSSGVA